MAKMLIPPVFSDPEQARSARWLHLFLLLALLVFVSYLVVMPVAFWNGIAIRTIPLATTIFFAVALAGAWVLMRFGLLRPAISTTLVALFILPTYLNLVVYQSIRSPDIWVYFILIPLTGLLLGRRQMIYFALLCLVFIALLFYLETTAILTPKISPQPTLIDGLLLGISILLSALLSQATIHKAEAKAHEAQRSMRALLQSNQQLEQSRVELQQARDGLEIRVEDRTKELRYANQRLQNEIHERQRLMDALSYSEANWRSLVENAPELIVTLTTTGTIRFVNRAIGGQTPEQLLGQPITAIHTAPQHQQVLVDAVHEVFTTGKTVSYESEEKRGDYHFWRINRLGPIYEAEEISSLILLSTDITEQKQTEAAMIQAQKLESMGIMAGGVAHDFNNLLTAMIGQATLALGKLNPDQQLIRDHIQNLLFASHRATELTHQMLNYAGHTPSAFVPINLNRLIQDNIQFFSASIAKSVKLHGDLAGDLAEITGDPGQIQQLIMNLILNAADAIGEQSGEITVTTTTRQLDAHDLQNGDQDYWRWSGTPLAPGRYICLTIADTGCGMDGATLQKIFDPFFTTKFTGRGLGLASVIGIVRSHGGGIHVSSTIQVGTTFQILFPISESAPKDEEVVSWASEHVELANKLILVIDDEDDVRQVTTEILELSEIRTLEASNGKAGLQLFQDHITEIDLVLLDLSMPGMSGEEVVRRLWELKPGVRIVLLSGYDEYEVNRRLGSAYQISFLQKPYNVERLLQIIEEQFAKPTNQPYHPPVERVLA